MATPPREPHPDVVPEGSAPEPAGSDEELARLRAEVSSLRAQADTRAHRASVLTTLRRGTAAVLIAVTAFALVASVVGGWAAITVLNTDRWVSTVAPLPQDPAVATAIADYGTTQVFEAVDVEQRLRTVLPPQAAFIAGPVTDQFRNQVRKTVSRVLRSDRFQPVWVELNRTAHERALAIINGSSDVVSAGRDRVDINLLPLINQVLRELSAQLPTLFGKQLTLPDLSSGTIPDNLRERVQKELGVTLPANFAQFTVYDSGQLWAAQQAVKWAKRGVVLLVAGTILLLAAAVLIAPDRRRTLLQFGLWVVIAAVAVSAVLKAVRGQVLEQVPSGVYRDGVAAAMTTIFSLLRTRGTQLIWLGAILAVVMYLVGPGRGATWLRRQLAVGARAAGRATRTGADSLATHGPGWTTRHLDAVRVGGVVVAVVLALLLSSWTSLLVIALLLVAFEVGVTVFARAVARRSAPDPVVTPSGVGSTPLRP